ncbi:hypothetical protein AB4Z30_05705 [Paenibacillus sp. 2TAF8]|uniref:hypothetical protein n=1 Tax=Paenibacillus sp. 2TAF8 TaxID=3233020 RepID=UPI003F9C6A09
MEFMRSNYELIQNNIEDLLEKYRSQPVGSGYIDIITNFDLIENLILELSDIGIAVNGVTWWCLCSEDNMKQYSCPHGMGGPKSDYYGGWYSEMGVDYESFYISQNTYDQLENGQITSEEIKLLNENVKTYIFEFTKDELFSKCFAPAIWLHVPSEWKRLSYMKYEKKSKG